MKVVSELRRAIDTLPTRLALVFALLVLPPTIISIYFTWNSFIEQTARSKLQVRQMAALTATYESKFFDDARAILQKIGNEDSIRNQHSDCGVILSETARRTPEFESIGFFDTSGRRICASDEAFGDVSRRAWMQEVSRFRSFAISDYTVSPNSPFPIIVAAQAVYGSEGSFIGVLAGSIRLYWLSAFMREMSLPPESVFYLIDSNGNILADRAAVLGQNPSPGAAGARSDSALGSLASIVGNRFAAPVLERSQTEFEAEGPDGVKRVFSSVALPYGNVTVLFGMPANTAIGWLERDLLNTALALLAIWCAGIGAAWGGTRYLVTRWTGRLRGMARAYGQGNYLEKPDFSKAPRELRDLGETLALMARRIETREEELRASLEQKNVLLKEIHHRVKNNLQIVSSLLNIRGGGLVNDADRVALSEVKAHVRALALAHRHLYEGDDVQRVELRAFLGELCQRTLPSLSTRTSVRLKIDIPEFRMPTDRAVPIALLVTEAMTNALKHAFPDGPGTIRVAFVPREDGGGTLTVADDGIGISQAAQSARGIGIRLIEAFAQQIDGELSIEGPPGTVIRVAIRPPRAVAEPGAAEPGRPDGDAEVRDIAEARRERSKRGSRAGAA